MDDIWDGLQRCYRDLKANFKAKYGSVIRRVGSIGISAMMHGYLVLDRKDDLLVPFRTWRNNNAEEQARKLSQIFNYPIPARWSIAHLYYAIEKNEPHIWDIAFQTTLEGYVHYMLTGEKVIGIGEASGMFPIDIENRCYDATCLEKFNRILKENRLPYTLENIFPKILLAGEQAGVLSEKGAKLLEPDGDLESGIPFCPPEGDAGTGMVATNAVRKGTGNISAGTSIFSMIVLDRTLSKVHPEIDLVTTPNGNLVAMVHCNNCTSDINAWMSLFYEAINLFGNDIGKNELYSKLFLKTLEGEADCGGLLTYNYVSGEHITDVPRGRPMFIRTAESGFSLANFMRANIYSAFASLRLGMDILTKEEQVKIDSVIAHGGIFKTKGVAQRFLAAALKVPVSVNETSNEGGPFGMAALAMYMLKGKGMSLEDYLDSEVFGGSKLETIVPDDGDMQGFDKFMNRFANCLDVVRLAAEKEE